MPAAQDRLIIAFDGECLMCSRGIRWVAERDEADRIRFTRLQDPRGAELARRAGLESLDSMVVEHHGRTVVRSEAVLEVLRSLGRPWSALAAIGQWIPLGWRDHGYDYIAARRHRWFGKGDACDLPSEALRSRLLEA